MNNTGIFFTFNSKLTWGKIFQSRLKYKINRSCKLDWSSQLFQLTFLEKNIILTVANVGPAL